MPANMAAVGCARSQPANCRPLANLLRAASRVRPASPGDHRLRHGGGCCRLAARQEPARAATEIPSVGIITDTYTDLLGAANDPGGAVEAAARLGGILRHAHPALRNASHQPDARILRRQVKGSHVGLGDRSNHPRRAHVHCRHVLQRVIPTNVDGGGRGWATPSWSSPSLRGRPAQRRGPEVMGRAAHSVQSRVHST